MRKNPNKLDLVIFQGENALPLLEQVKASFDHDPVIREYDGLTREDKVILLARPDIAFIGNKERASTIDIEYKKLRESGQPSHDRRRGAMICVYYERVK